MSEKVLIVGAAGMLGNAIFRFFSSDDRYTAFGTLRAGAALRHFTTIERQSLIVGVDVMKDSDLVAVLADVKPDIVINCVGVIKQHYAVRNHLITLSTNAVLPHRLAQLCRLAGARLVHISTDCVFSGRKGNYLETDFADADDLYGRSKYLGEINYPHTVTLRTSIIGHELENSKSLVDWFLSQQGTVKGYRSAIFSGLPTVEVARVIADFVIPHDDLTGVYHLSSEPINKCDLLGLVARIYKKNIEIIPNGSVVIDRSLNSERFRRETGYNPLPWPELISEMRRHYLRHNICD
jgi:dTDP-4-dehydrorhamnose reductase